MKRLKYSIDTSVLVAMAEGDKDCLECCRLLNNQLGQLVVCSTVLQECELILQENGTNKYPSKIGKAILGKMIPKWHILPEPAAEPNIHGYSLEFSRKLQHIVDPESSIEINDFLVFTDSAQIECDFLLTWSVSHLKFRKQNSPFYLTAKHLMEHHVEIVTPSEILDFYKSNK